MKCHLLWHFIWYTLFTTIFRDRNTSTFFFWKSLKYRFQHTKFCYLLHHNRIFVYHAGTQASSTSVGPFPGNWLAACIADLTPDLQVLLSWGSTVVSFHSPQSFSVSFFHVSLGLPAPGLPSICISHAVLSAPLDAPHAHTSEAFSLSKWGWGPQALPVVCLTLP